MPGWGGGVVREGNKWKEKKEENDCEGRKKWTAVELSLAGETEKIQGKHPDNTS